MMCLKEGIIVKLIGGLYTVKADDGKKYELKARGKFRHLGESPKVGDHVVFDDFYIFNFYIGITFYYCNIHEQLPSTILCKV